MEEKKFFIMNMQEDSFLNKKNHSPDHSKGSIENSKENSLFEYQNLNLKTKKKIRPLIYNLGLLDVSKLRNLEKYLLLFFDITSFLSMLFLAQIIRYSTFYFRPGDILYITCPLMVTLTVNYIGGLYKMDFASGHLKSLGMILTASFASLLFISFLVYLAGIDHFVGNYFGRGVLLGAIGGFSICSFTHRFFLGKLFVKIRVKRNYLVLTDAKEYDLLLQESANFPGRENFDFFPLKDQEQLFSNIEKNNYIGLIVGESALQNSFLIKKLMVLRLGGMRIFNMQDFFEDAWQKVPIIELKDQWFVMGNGFKLLHNPVELKIKRILDIAFSLAAFILAMPLMLVVALSIKTMNPGSVIYSQTRTGQRGKKFTLYKFRTMVVSAENDKAQWAQKNDARVTKIGKILRVMRIDELPQFWNVLKGDMSFIGPRPERPELNYEIEKHIPYYNLRHLLKPGITGWAQVHYPYGASVQDALEKLQYDFYYIKNYGLTLDISIILKTIKVVLLGKGGR